MVVLNIVLYLSNQSNKKPPPMTEYTIISENSIGDLIKNVNAAIEQGWKCQGGLAIDLTSYYFQAMIKETPTTNKPEL